MFRKDHISNYLDQQAGPPLETVNSKLKPGIIVVIPSHAEPQLKQAILSLSNAKRPSVAVELIVVLNHAQNAEETTVQLHLEQYEELLTLSKHISDEQFQMIAPKPVNIHPRKAGVGYARKLGMDEALRRFAMHHIFKGIIVNFDADCLCHEDYFIEIENYFSRPEHKHCVSIGFEHRIESQERFLDKGIVDYELHLRYYIQAQRWIQYPFAYHTLGSCFAVEADAYARQGGMNSRQAGEDFYFMHKFSVIDALGTIPKALVFPSGRISDRVPFGTGRAMIKFQEQRVQMSYSLEAILIFGQFLNTLRSSIEMDPSEWKMKLAEEFPILQSSLSDQGMWEALNQFRKNTSSNAMLLKKITAWLNPFVLMKYLHDARVMGFPDEEVSIVANKLLQLMQMNVPSQANNTELLDFFRKLDSTHPEILFECN